MEEFEIFQLNQSQEFKKGRESQDLPIEEQSVIESSVDFADNGFIMASTYHLQELLPSEGNRKRKVYY